MTLKKAIIKKFDDAHRTYDGNSWRQAVDIFTDTQVSYQDDIRFLKSAIISDANWRKEWLEFKKMMIDKIRSGENGNMLADHEIDLVCVISFCNNSGRQIFAQVFKDRFGFTLCSVFNYEYC